MSFMTNYKKFGEVHLSPYSGVSSEPTYENKKQTNNAEDEPSTSDIPEDVIGPVDRKKTRLKDNKRVNLQKKSHPIKDT